MIIMRCSTPCSHDCHVTSMCRLVKPIGSGHFGTVSKGLWVPSGTESEEVAVKTVKSTTELERVKLLQEAAIMGQFAHPNVVRLIGVVTVGDPVSVECLRRRRGVASCH